VLKAEKHVSKALYHVFNMRMEYALPFITGRMYGLNCAGDQKGHIYPPPRLTSFLRSETDISMNLECRNLKETVMS
jgi:hypothetical protein